MPNSSPAKPPHSFFGRAWLLMRETFSEWSDDNAARLAAALACYALLSIAPLIVLCVVVAGMAFGEDAARGRIAAEIGAVVGADAGNAIQTIAANARTPSSGALGWVIGIVVLLFGASGVFGELQSSLDTMWEVQPKPGRGIMGMIRDRFFSVSMVMCVAFLLLVSLVISAALAAIGHFFEQALPGGAAVWQVVNFTVAFLISAALFALTFKVVPDAKIQWKDVWIGGSVTALLFTIGKILLALYIGKSGTTTVFGAAGSLAAFVIWVYYSSQVLFLGAEFTQVYARHFGSRIEPSSNALPLKKDAPTSAKAAPDLRNTAPRGA